MSSDKEEGMEKFGVVTEDPPKTASSDETRCPLCNEVVETDSRSNTPRCPVHGTEPFEKKL